MRRIVSSLTAAALAFSLVAQATPANAVAGYDSAYSGESAFLTLGRGERGSFTVFFANTGSSAWTLAAGTQVDLAVCLDDKVTCDVSDSGEAAFNDSWKSATRYAAQTQSAVAPGQIGTFTYSVRVPSSAAAGTYTFNGALVLSSTGEDIHNEGYFQDATVEVETAAATLTDIDPQEGSIDGGDAVILTGTGFECSPQPTVRFGTADAEVQSCTATSLSVDTPAHAAGSVDVTVINAGAAASNALQFTYVDDARPDFTSVTAVGQTITLRFSEPVCAEGGTLTANTELRVKVNGADVTETAITFSDCDDDEFSLTGTLSVTEGIAEGDEVTVTVTTTGADDIFDQDDNPMDLGRSQTTIAEADETAPVIQTATATDEQTLEVVYSEPVECAGTDRAQFVFDPDETGESDVVATDMDCDGSSSVTLKFPTNTFAGGVTGVLEYVADDDPVEDTSGNEASNQNVTIVPTQQDEPTIEDAKITTTVGFRNTADAGDKVTIVFNEVMNSSTSGDLIRVQDGDGTIVDLKCAGAAVGSNSILEVSCAYSSDTLVLTLLEDAVGETITAGDTGDLQWPATIIDTSNVKDEELKDVDIANSADKIIDFE